MVKEKDSLPPEYDPNEDFNDVSTTTDASWRGMLGQILYENGLITGKQWDDAEQERRLSGRNLGEILLSRKVLSRDQLKTVMSGRPELDLPSLTPRPSLESVVQLDWSPLLATLELVGRELRSQAKRVAQADPLRLSMEDLRERIAQLVASIEESIDEQTGDLPGRMPRSPSGPKLG